MDTDFIALETMLAAQETAKWTLWMMYATWVAGTATFLAVVTTLYLANRKPKPSISSHCSTVIISPAPGISLIGLSVEIANIGIYPVMVSSITWECGGNKKFVMSMNGVGSASLPKKLEHGESAMFFHQFDDFGEWKALMLKNIENSQGKLKKLRYLVRLGTGQSLIFKLDRPLMNSLKT
ncbi:hypothetical protein PRCB_16485 [Pantoea rodasii]|uniref:Uncharacterized protein n=1 Tax=Pantoea rodasii TaxID=1076549 RepID=A0A2M9WBZ2_9GAMM|nr:hypothetical protein [Pantoea rodasii]ORM64526.1 hypothetical protein HA45_09155 [Pantoea rodasii]PJZ04998.1 hypothetical protein PRCB_16485 [Pantoea rodasii]